MTIETKYNIGDELFTFKDNEVIAVMVCDIKIDITDGYASAPKVVDFTYLARRKYCMFRQPKKEYKTWELFPTKEALIHSL